MLKKCIVPRLAAALSLTAAFAVVTLLASARPSAETTLDQRPPTSS